MELFDAEARDSNIFHPCLFPFFFFEITVRRGRKSFSWRSPIGNFFPLSFWFTLSKNIGSDGTDGVTFRRGRKGFDVFVQQLSPIEYQQPTTYPLLSRAGIFTCTNAYTYTYTYTTTRTRAHAHTHIHTYTTTHAHPN